MDDSSDDEFPLAPLPPDKRKEWEAQRLKATAGASCESVSTACSINNTIKDAHLAPNNASRQTPTHSRTLNDLRGENALLRSQLAVSDQRHRSELTKVLEQNSRARQENDDKLAQLRRQLEENESKLKFLMVELRAASLRAQSSLSGRSAPAPSQIEERHQQPQPSMQSTQSLPQKNLRSASATFSDGFVMKRPRLAPSTHQPIVVASPPSPVPLSQTSASLHPEFLVPRKDPNGDQRADVVLEALRRQPIVDLHSLAKLRMPDTAEPTLERVMGIEHRGQNLGQIVISAVSTPDLVEKLMGLLEDSKFLYSPYILSLLWKLPVELLRLQAVISQWLDDLEPLPQISDTSHELLVDRILAVRLTSILYAFDLIRERTDLLSQDIEPRCLERAINSGNARVAMRAAELATRTDCRVQVSSHRILLGRQVAPPPTLEDLFGGLIDGGPIHATSLALYSPSYLSVSLVGLVNSKLRKISAEALYDLKVAAIAISQRPEFRWPGAVLETLMMEVERPSDVQQRRLVAACIRYFWMYLETDDDGPDYSELAVCAAKVRSGAAGPVSIVTKVQASDLLHRCLGPAEVDELAQLFGSL